MENKAFLTEECLLEIVEALEKIANLPDKIDNLECFIDSTEHIKPDPLEQLAIFRKIYPKEALTEASRRLNKEDKQAISKMIKQMG